VTLGYIFTQPVTDIRQKRESLRRSERPRLLPVRKTFSNFLKNATIRESHKHRKMASKKN